MSRKKRKDNNCNYTKQALENDDIVDDDSIHDPSFILKQSKTAQSNNIRESPYKSFIVSRSNTKSNNTANFHSNIIKSYKELTSSYNSYGSYGSDISTNITAGSIPDFYSSLESLLIDPDSARPNVFEGKLAYMAIGNTHSLSLTNIGCVYSIGSGDCGQLGLGDCTICEIPRPIDTLTDVGVIACGDFHCLALTKLGTLFSWGDNKYGQLGTGDPATTPFCSTPTIINFFENTDVIHISCGAEHSAAICDDIQIFTWGNGKQGRLGHGDEVSKFLPTKLSFPVYSSSSSSPSSLPSTPSLLSSNFKHAYISCGTYHSLVSFWKEGVGIIYGFGLGNLYPNNININTEDYVTRIACGVFSTLLLTNSGNVLTMTSDWSHEPVVTLEDKRVTQIVCGRNLFAALAHDGCVYKWTDNELPQPYIVPDHSGRKVVSLTCKGDELFVVSTNVENFNKGETFVDEDSQKVEDESIISRNLNSDYLDKSDYAYKYFDNNLTENSSEKSNGSSESEDSDNEDHPDKSDNANNYSSFSASELSNSEEETKDNEKDNKASGTSEDIDTFDMVGRIVVSSGSSGSSGSMQENDDNKRAITNNEGIADSDGEASDSEESNSEESEADSERPSPSSDLPVASKSSFASDTHTSIVQQFNHKKNKHKLPDTSSFLVADTPTSPTNVHSTQTTNNITGTPQSIILSPLHSNLYTPAKALSPSFLVPDTPFNPAPLQSTVARKRKKPAPFTPAISPISSSSNIPSSIPSSSSHTSSTSPSASPIISSQATPFLPRFPSHYYTPFITPTRENSATPYRPPGPKPPRIQSPASPSDPYYVRDTQEDAVSPATTKQENSFLLRFEYSSDDRSQCETDESSFTSPIRKKSKKDTSPVKPPPSKLKNIVVMFDGFDESVTKELSEQVISLSGRVSLGSSFHPDITHIVKNPENSVGLVMLAGIVTSRWVVNELWIRESFSLGYFVDESCFGKRAMQPVCGKKFCVQKETFTNEQTRLMGSMVTLLKLGQAAITDESNADFILKGNLSKDNNQNGENNNNIIIGWNGFVQFITCNLS